MSFSVCASSERDRLAVNADAAAKQIMTAARAEAYDVEDVCGYMLVSNF